MTRATPCDWRRIASWRYRAPGRACVPHDGAGRDAADVAGRVHVGTVGGRAARTPRPRARPSRRVGRTSGCRARAVDFTGSTDPRAKELERRVVLSQYLTAVNSAGDVPPQEEGLFSNSWYGKFHLEMHAWHAAHFAAWGRPELLERSMPLVPRTARRRRRRARRRTACAAPGGRRWWGPKGARARAPSIPSSCGSSRILSTWPKRCTARGRDARRSRSTATMVFETADLLASWPHLRRKAEALRARPAADSGAGELSAADHVQPDVRARVLALRARRPRRRGASGSGLKRDPKWDDVLAEALAAAAEGRAVSRRRIAAGSVGARAVGRVLEGRREA